MAAEVHLPDSFRRRILHLGEGDRGDRERWLADLPEIVETFAERWDLRLGEAFPPSYSYVVAAERQFGEPCVLKLELPLPPEAEGAVREARALQIAGPSAVRLLEEDGAAGALLLARASGGPLAERCHKDDDAATEILASAMAGFWAPAPPESGLPSLSRLEDTFERFESGPHGASRRRELPESLSEIDSGLRDLRAAASTARRVLEELLADRTPAVVVHGDLHHDNVLQDEGRGWVVIDPKGFVGDAGYDTGAMLYNPFAYTEKVSDLASLVRRRLDVMTSIVRLDRERLEAWGYVKAVLSLLWSLEGEGETLERNDPRLGVMAALRAMI